MTHINTAALQTTICYNHIAMVTNNESARPNCNSSGNSMHVLPNESIDEKNLNDSQLDNISMEVNVGCHDIPTKVCKDSIYGYIYEEGNGIRGSWKIVQP